MAEIILPRLGQSWKRIPAERNNLPFAHDKFKEENWKLITVLAFSVVSGHVTHVSIIYDL